MLKLRQLTWMSEQWQHFRRLALITTGAIWTICWSGALLLPKGNFSPCLALPAMFCLCTGVSIYLIVVARREIEELDRLTMASGTAYQFHLS